VQLERVVFEVEDLGCVLADVQQERVLTRGTQEVHSSVRVRVCSSERTTRMFGGRSTGTA
jgi:hypothetical protein